MRDINSVAGHQMTSPLSTWRPERFPQSLQMLTKALRSAVAWVPLYHGVVQLPLALAPWLWNVTLTFRGMYLTLGFPGGSGSKESACNTGDLSLISGSGRSPGEGNGNPLQYSCLGSPMDRGAWWVTVHGVSRVGHDLATKTNQPTISFWLPDL